MSLPDFSTQGSLFSTAALGASLFPEDDRYRLFAQLVYPCLVRVRPTLEKAYSPDTGRTAIEPVFLLGVCLLQYVDGIPDRQAVDWLRYHAGWNFALNRQLGDDRFHPSTLSRFRERLEAHGLAALGFQAILDGLVEAGLVRRNARQRLDSTQVFGLVSKMSRVEGLRQTLRLALEELAEGVEVQARPEQWPLWWTLYVESQLDYRASREVLGSKMAEAGAAAAQILAWLKQHPQLAAGEQARLLARVFEEQFVLEAGEFRPRGKGELESGRVQNPLDPEATYGVKQQGGEAKSHVGYKAQVAETVVERQLKAGEPTSNFITAIAIQPAHHSDEAGAEVIAQAQASLGLEPPPVLYVDGAYVSAAKLVEAAHQGRELIGPVQAAPRQYPDQFTMENFQVEVERLSATCPAGKPHDRCNRVVGGKYPGQYRFEWKQSTCAACELRERCLGKGLGHKTIVVGEHHSALQARRLEQKTEPFRQRLHHRAAIEGTQSELVRAHGLRRARYRGLAMVQLQAWLTGAACNLKRWLRRVAWGIRCAYTPAEAATAAPVG
jgi:transposase